MNKYISKSTILNKIPHFDINNAICKCGCGELYINPALEDYFDELIETVGGNLSFIEIYRCEESNALSGKTPSSTHVSGKGALLYCPSGIEVEEFIDLCEDKGAKHVILVDEYEDIIYLDIEEEDTGEYIQGEGL